MQARDLGRFAEAAGGFLRQEHGFSYAKRRYTRSDKLIRSAWFMPLNATADRYIFDVVFDLGIPGVSAFGPKAQRHVVRAHAQQASRANPDYPVPEFVLQAGDDGRPVAPGVDEVVRRLTDDFLLRYPDPITLYEMVRDDGMIAARDSPAAGSPAAGSPAAGNPAAGTQGAGISGAGVPAAATGTRAADAAGSPFQRLRLDPFNLILRLELAAVYGAFLGRDDEVATVLEVARRYAAPHRVEYMIPRIESGIDEARKARVG